MPRTYKPKPGARPYLSAQPDTLQKAYEELQQGSSERKVCEKYRYDFSRTKLRNYSKTGWQIPTGVTNTIGQKMIFSTFKVKIKLYFIFKSMFFRF